MNLAVAVLYLTGVALVTLAAVGVTARVNLALLGFASALLAFSLPAIDAGFVG